MNAPKISAWKHNNKIQSLKQSLKKRVMEYKTMHSVVINNKDMDKSKDLDISTKSKNKRFIPLSKTVSNCPNAKLPCKCSKFPALNAPYIYWMKSYKWLANAFCHSTPGSFSVYDNRELQKLIKAYEKWSVMKLQSSTEEQIRKDIVRTFPNNSGCHSMYKVLSAYSNLKEMRSSWLEIEDPILCETQTSNLVGEDDETPRFVSRTEVRRKNDLLRSELLDSFWEISFEDSTQYVQGMNFIVGILWHHLSPELAFWLFVKLMKDYDLEDNYTPGLQGFKTKSDILTGLIQKNLPELFEFFVNL